MAGVKIKMREESQWRSVCLEKRDDGNWEQLPERICHSIRPAERILPAHVRAIGLRRIAIHERPSIEWMPQTSHLVLDGEQRLIGVDIDDIPETPFVRVGFARDQLPLDQVAVRAGKIGD